MFSTPLGVPGSRVTVTLAPCRQKLVVRLGRQQYRRPNLLIDGGVVMAERTPKKVVVSAAAAKKAGARATKASAKLEGRVIPADHRRSAAVKAYLAKQQSPKR